MYAPGKAALLLAALAALPCRGTDADSSSKSSNETNTNKTQPIINEYYQMLHGEITHNHSEPLSNSNLNLTHNLNFHNDPIYPPVDKIHECCQIDNINNINQVNIVNINEGAKNVHSTDNDRDPKRNRKRRVVKIVRSETTTVGATRKSVGSTTIFPLVNKPSDRRRKPGETGSSSPLLNYIFDTYSNTHYHREDRNGNGNSIYVAASSEVEALVGSTAHLDCKVDALHDKLVSWVRRKNDEDPMELLTTGTQLYTADERYSASFIPPDIWRLEVKEVRPTDAAFYDCQLSAHPPRSARVTLRVPEVSIRIVDGAGAGVSEQVCEVGSTVALRCEVRGLRMEGGPSLLWYRKDDLLNDDTTRGGISVKTEFGLNGANSVLRVARVRSDDAGQYTCSVARSPPPAPDPAHVMLHVIKGESLAELHQGGSSSFRPSGVKVTIFVIVALCPKLYVS